MTISPWTSRQSVSSQELHFEYFTPDFDAVAYELLKLSSEIQPDYFEKLDEEQTSTLEASNFCIAEMSWPW